MSTTLLHPTAADLAASLAGTRWVLEPDDTEVVFAVRRTFWLPSVQGCFTEFTGTLEIGEAGEVRGELRIDASSVNTGLARRDRHLRSADFFHCERHPVVLFTATRLTSGLHGTLEAAGRQVTLDLTPAVERTEERLRLLADATIDARALGMTWAPVGSARTTTTLGVDAHLRRVP
jgi:polyisoprenoid-binding protein YceI